MIDRPSLHGRGKKTVGSDPSNLNDRPGVSVCHAGTTSRRLVDARDHSPVGRGRRYTLAVARSIARSSTRHNVSISSSVMI